MRPTGATFSPTCSAGTCGEMRDREKTSIAAKTTISTSSRKPTQDAVITPQKLSRPPAMAAILTAIRPPGRVSCETAPAAGRRRWRFHVERAGTPARRCEKIAPVQAERTVDCVKLGRPAPGLAQPPLPGDLGRRIFERVSAEAWAGWLEHQKMLVNEYRLNLADSRARKYLREQTERYFFGEGADVAHGYVPPKS